MNLVIEQEDDGRWIAEIDDLDGVLVYGETREDAVRTVKTLALRVTADRLEMAKVCPTKLKVDFSKPHEPKRLAQSNSA